MFVRVMTDGAIASGVLNASLVSALRNHTPPSLPLSLAIWRRHADLQKQMTRSEAVGAPFTALGFHSLALSPKLGPLSRRP